MKKRKLTCEVMLELSEGKLEDVYNKLLRMESVTSTSNYVFTIQGLNSSIHKEFIRKNIAVKFFMDLRVMLE